MKFVVMGILRLRKGSQTNNVPFTGKFCMTLTHMTCNEEDAACSKKKLPKIYQVKLYSAC